MITLPLKMRYGEKPLRQPAAWLIPGGEPRIWLDEMLAWGVPLAGATLFLVPRAARDLAPQGVLVVLPAGFVPKVTHRSQPYATVVATHNVYLPITARFDPDASDGEVALLAGDTGDCILHPTLGRIGLEASDRRRVVDLLAAPPERPACWDRAEPGQRVNSRLMAIVPAVVPSLEAMLDQGRDGIGSQSSSLDELPPEPGEPSQGFFSQLGHSLQRKLAGMIQRLAETGGAGSQPPPSGAAQPRPASKARSKPGMLAKMADWARQKVAHIDESLRKARQRELHRLMNLLENDPDQGLRFALPCDQGNPPARPSATLPSHNVNFDLRRLGDRGPRDRWEVPSDLYSRLRARYM
jgi:hypothetical protein